MNNQRKENDFSSFKSKISLDGDKALNEIKSGQKVSHWMWYIFPQLEVLGKSEMAKYYGIKSSKEAKAFLQDETLKKFLFKITLAVTIHIKNKTRTLTQIFGSIDKNKFLSCMTLFYYAAKSSNENELKKVFKFCKLSAEFELNKIDEKTYDFLFR